MLDGYQNVYTEVCGVYAMPPIDGVDGEHIVTVMDNADFYVDLMKSLFDFDSIKRLLDRPDFTMCFDGMHGVAGPYAKKIFGDIFGVQELLRCNVLPDFGGGHPDPNLTYAKDLVDKMGIFKPNL